MLLTDDLQFTAPGPQTVAAATVVPVGTPGATDYWYWIVAHYPIGTSVSGPFFITNAPDTLSGANYVQLVWQTQIGASSYDVLRTNSPQFPQVAGNYALATALAATQLIDQGQALQSYNPATLNLVAPAFAHIHLNNRDYSVPTIEMPVGQIWVNRIQFADGSTLSSGAGSGLTPGGPTGAVQINNAGTLGGNSGFVYSGSNVGIATASPGFPLDVNGVEHIAARLLIGQTTDDGSTLIQGYSNSGPGTVIAINTDSIATCQIILGSYSGSNTNQGAIYEGKAARGSVAAPAALHANDALILVEGVGYNGISFPVAAYIGMYAESNWSSGVQPAFINFSTISSGSLTERMRISSAGNVGIATSNPACILDINATAVSVQGIHISSDGTDNGAYFQTFSTGRAIIGAGMVLNTTPAWIAKQPTAAALHLNPAANLVNLSFDAGLTAGSSFTPTSRLTILSSGNVGIGITPAYLLHLLSDSAGKPSTSTWTIVSDIRTKRNIRRFEGDIDIIRRLDPIVAEYNGKGGTPEGQRVVSFDAEKLSSLVPSCVTSVKTKLDPGDEQESDLLGVNIHELFFHLLRAAQQLDSRLAKLEALNK